MSRWHVFPCVPGAKRPAVDRWEQRASTLYRGWPGSRHNIGVACGPSQLVVIDLDTCGPGIPDGRDALTHLCAQAGQPWPATHTVRTPSGGWHLYYQAPATPEIRNSAGLLGPMIDVRACGGYVLGAGSTVNGHPYTALDDDPPAPLPAWITRLLIRCPARTQGPRDRDRRLIATFGPS